MLLIYSVPLLAKSTTAFDYGMVAARSGDYRLALQYFLKAEEGGMDSGRLYYNIGVSHYKLGHYDAAVQAFEKAARDPQLRALSYYNLALVARAQDDTSAALSWTEKCLDASRDERLTGLAEALRQQLAPGQATRTDRTMTGGSKTTMLFNAHIGYDDNVTLLADSQLLNSSNRGDSFIDAFYFGRLTLNSSGPYVWNVDGSVYTQQYSSLHNYNLSMLLASGSLQRDISVWRLKSELSMALFTLAGNGLYRTQTLKLSARWRRQAWQWRGEFELSGIDAANAAYEYLGGSMYRSKIRADWRQDKKHRYKASYTYETNDRNDLTTATTFSSYSPTRQTLKVSLETDLNRHLSSSFGVDGRYSRYRDQNISTTSAPIQRQEQRYRFNVGVTYKLRAAIELTGEYNLTRNFSNIDRYDYTSNVVKFGGSILW